MAFARSLTPEDSDALEATGRAYDLDGEAIEDDYDEDAPPPPDRPARLGGPLPA
jgi:hypothetical protein